MFIVSTLNENRINKEIRKLLAYLSCGAADAQPKKPNLASQTTITRGWG